MPAATIITSVFVNTARAYTRLMGVPDFPYLVCPHPIGNASDAGRRERARMLTPGVRSLLTTGELSHH